MARPKRTRRWTTEEDNTLTALMESKGMLTNPKCFAGIATKLNTDRTQPTQAECQQRWTVLVKRKPKKKRTLSSLSDNVSNNSSNGRPAKSSKSSAKLQKERKKEEKEESMFSGSESEENQDNYRQTKEKIVNDKPKQSPKEKHNKKEERNEGGSMLSYIAVGLVALVTVFFLQSSADSGGDAKVLTVESVNTLLCDTARAQSQTSSCPDWVPQVTSKVFSSFNSNVEKYTPVLGLLGRQDDVFAFSAAIIKLFDERPRLEINAAKHKHAVSQVRVTVAEFLKTTPNGIVFFKNLMDAPGLASEFHDCWDYTVGMLKESSGDVDCSGAVFLLHIEASSEDMKSHDFKNILSKKMLATDRKMQSGEHKALSVRIKFWAKLSD
eukprot:m.89563 g.89563  ORF g.89563 m.89563 type:complete len:381 (-) comp13229_c0_seq2:102-1244(-)